MKQRDLFEPAENPTWQAFCDGASRGNPGPASYGVVVCDPAGRLVKEARRHIGHNTNQVAEYEALIRALEEALKAGARRLRVLTDSQFVVKQFTGEYKIRDARMQALMGRVRALQGKFDSVELQHIARSSHPHNKRADELANEALDELD